jgi:hypothetical protein
VTDKSWKCTNGETRHILWTNTFKQALTTETLRHETTGKITGWNLTGVGGTQDVVSLETTGYPLYNCAGAGWWNYMAGINTDQRHSLGSDLFVNGLLLPEMPVVIEVPNEPAA